MALGTRWLVPHLEVELDFDFAQFWFLDCCSNHSLVPRYIHRSAAIIIEPSSLASWMFATIF